MNKQKVLDVLLLNLGMLFISTSGAVGRSIDMPPTITIFWRAILATLLLAIIIRLARLSFRLSSDKDIRVILVSGILMGMHWVFYFYALYYSNVAIGMLSIFTYPVFTAVLEPLILKTQFQPIHILLALLTLIGIYFLVPEFDFEADQTKAVIFGLISALSYSFRNLIMKKQIAKYNGLVLMFYQAGITTLILIPFLFTLGDSGIAEQWPAILFLAIVTTVLGHTIFLMSFRRFSITTASIMSCTQPIFGIILGAIFLKEYPEWATYIGGACILVAVVVESVRAKAD